MKTIFILRKPLEGNLVRNTLAHGCGGLNIDAARISFRDLEKLGRFPANFLLTHLEGCELRGTKKVKSGTAFQDNKTKSNYVYGGFNPVNMKGKAGYAGEDGKEEVADWACVEGCSVKEIEGYNDEGGASRFFKCLEEDK